MLDIIKMVVKWKKQLLLLVLLAMVASAIVTMPAIMSPYYQSKIIFYLSNPASTDRAALFNNLEGGGVSMFGGKEDVNRFLSILNSAPVSKSIIDKFDLGKHYNIEADNQQLFDYYTQKEFAGNFKAIRNELGAIEVSVLDTDNRLAAAMVKEIVHLSDSIYRSLIMENKSTVLTLIDKQIAEKRASLQGGGSDAQEEELLKLLSIRDQYAVSSSAAFKTLYVVEEPFPAVKKTKPVRWLAVVSSALAALLAGVFFALLIELYRHAEQYKDK